MQCIFHFSAASITDIDLVLTITLLFSASRSWTRSLRLLMIVSGLPFCKDKKRHLKFVITWRTMGPWGYKTDWSATEIIQLLLRLYVDMNNILVDFNASQQSFKQEMFVIFDKAVLKLPTKNSILIRYHTSTAPFPQTVTY